MHIYIIIDEVSMGFLFGRSPKFGVIIDIKGPGPQIHALNLPSPWMPPHGGHVCGQFPQSSTPRVWSQGRREGLHSGSLTCPLKRDHFSREYIFQPSIFRGHVSFQGSINFLFVQFFPNENYSYWNRYFEEAVLKIDLKFETVFFHVDR